MSLFVVLFWCVAGASAVFRPDSRFGVFNSRLGGNKFPFSRQREFAREALSRLVVFVTRQHFARTIEKIPGSTGITGNCHPNRRTEFLGQTNRMSIGARRIDLRREDKRGIFGGVQTFDDARQCPMKTWRLKQIRNRQLSSTARFVRSARSMRGHCRASSNV